MSKFFLLVAALGLGGTLLLRVSAAKPAAPTYMQIFYEGPGWFSGRRVLVYSPAFRGKTEEVLAEPDSIRRISPNGFIDSVEGELATGPVTTHSTTISTGEGTLVADANGRMRPETAADRKRARQRELASQNRGLKLQEMRADLGKATLTKALNEAAADGWEVVQLAPSGSQGGLVYLLRRQPG